MTSPTESLVDNLAARATVETYGDISLITVPGIEILPESQRLAVFKKAEQRLISDLPDADDLRLRLQSITPPPDEEEDAEQARLLEAQARQDLESDGCVPCYPPHLDVPIRNPPEEYRQIVEYWQSFGSTGDVVLCAQKADWRDFREFQQRQRYRYRNKSFSIFVNEVRERRRAHGLDDNVHLLRDPQQQSRQQNWIEFQNYHLRLHELQEKKRDALQTDLENTQREASDTDMEGSAHRAQWESVSRQNLEFAERTLRWHEVILCWIEQCRVAMNPAFDKGSVDQNSSHRQRRSKRRNTPAVLGEAKVAKSTPKARNIRTRTSKATISKSISLESAATIPSGTGQTPERREMRPRRAKEKALGQLAPQRVTKADRFDDIETKSRPRTQCSGDGPIRDRAKPHHEPATQRLHPTPRTVKTRSQRISRAPMRWVPE